MPPAYPRLVAFFPKDGDGLSSDLRPNIVLDWSADMQTGQFSDDNTRAQLVMLLDTDTATIIETSYVDYEAKNRRVTLVPTQDLDRGKTYRVVVKQGVKDTYGRSSTNDYMWTFTTAGASIGKVQLLSPANYTIQSTFPTLSWLAVSGTGTIYYNVEIDNNPSFNSVTWSTVTTDVSVLPVGTFPSAVTYYWRVQAYSATATGAWSDMWSFFYGTVADVHDTTRQTWAAADSFGVSDTLFDNGESHLSAWPDFTIEFTSTPASTFSSFITVRKKSVLPRTDVDGDFDWTTWAGTWTQSGNSITFTPDEAPASNTRYEIILSKKMVNEDGLELGEVYKYYVTGKYDPYFVDILNIRSNFGAELINIPDDLINFYIHKASLDARAKYAVYLYGVGYFVGNSNEDLIRESSPDVKGWGVLKWTEAVATYNLLKMALIEEVRNVGRDRRLDDFSESLSGDFVNAIKEAMNRVKEEIETWEDLLTPTDSPMTTIRHYDWHPSVMDGDYSIMDVEANRDEWLRD